MMINRTRWLLWLIAIFVLSTVALGFSLFLYIYWYIKVSAGLEHLISRFNLERVDIAASHTWVVITVLSILVGLILVGLFLIFFYNLKTLQLFRLQRNFINNFTHELKTPVTSLRLYLETFLKHDLPREERLRYINFMMTDITRLSSTISSILDLAEIESRSYAGEFVAMEVAGVVDQFYKKNQHMFGDCVVNLHNPSCTQYTCLINAHLFEMLLTNLFTNAIKYNQSELPRIDIHFEQHNKNVLINFFDNGIGLAKADRKKIFKKFYQAGNAEDMSAKGTGLGLYLTANIARLHKGKIRAAGKPDGNGSVFTLSLPLFQEASDQP